MLNLTPPIDPAGRDLVLLVFLAPLKGSCYCCYYCRGLTADAADLWTSTTIKIKGEERGREIVPYSKFSVDPCCPLTGDNGTIISQREMILVT